MKRLLYYARLWRGYMRIGFLTLVQYPSDTVIWLVSMLLREASGFIGVLTIAHVAGGLGGWGLYEICLLFSMCAIIEAVGQAFFDNVWGIDHDIQKGTLDVLMVRPAAIYIQLQGRVFHFQALLSILVYAGIMIWSLVKLHITFSIGMAGFLLAFFLCGALINSGIYTIFNCLNFWLVQGSEFAELVQVCREFAKYPLSVFPGMVQGFFTFLIPFGFVGFYPAGYLSGKMGTEVLWQMPVCALAVVGIASLIWRKGIGSYNSTGT